MKKILKKIGTYLLFPHIVLMLGLIPLALVALLFAFLRWGSDSPLSYLAYALSAYALTVVCMRAPAIWRWLRSENKWLLRWRADVRWRVKLTLYFSLFLNVAYALFQLGLGLTHASVWFYTLAAYYILLVVMRLSLLRHTRRWAPGERPRAELLHYRRCGMLLVLMNLTLGGIVFFVTWQNRTFHHHEITTIAMAAYTFAALTLSILGLVRTRKQKSPVFLAVQSINLAAALVSMLTLECAMLTTFGTAHDLLFRRLMIGIFGTVVALFVLGLGIFMIVTATKKLKKEMPLASPKENINGKSE